jgi:hypothetical protein
MEQDDDEIDMESIDLAEVLADAPIVRNSVGVAVGVDGPFVAAVEDGGAFELGDWV